MQYGLCNVGLRFNEIMRVVLQRVSEASVTVDGETQGAIGAGLLVLLGIQKGDSSTEADKLVEKILHLRIFPDDKGKMNLSLVEVSGDLLVVPQFTLYADTSKGHRPSYAKAEAPEEAERLYEYFISVCRSRGFRVQIGRFRAHMQVALVNEGPVTIICDSE